MKIVNVAPLTLTVELDPTDCIALADACYARADDWDSGNASALLGALGSALLLGIAAIADQGMDDDPPTIAKVWRVWAPTVHLAAPGKDGTYGRMPVPPEYAD